MSEEWKCRKCGHLNTGRVTGMSYGSWSDFVATAQAAAAKAQIRCASCGADRISKSRKFYGPILTIVAIGFILVAMAGFLMTIGGIVGWFRGVEGTGRFALLGPVCLIAGFLISVLLQHWRDNI